MSFLGLNPIPSCSREASSTKEEVELIDLLDQAMAAVRRKWG